MRLRGRVELPPGRPGDFDHADVDPVTGRVFVAHTQFGTVDVIHRDSLEVIKTIDGCPEGSGVLCAREARIVFAASRGSGAVLFINPDTLEPLASVPVGPKPNGLALAESHDLLLVADVDAGDQSARLVQVSSRQVTATTRLPGRPRWCVFDKRSDRFLVNIRDPASLLRLSTSGRIEGSWPISSPGPHGLDLDEEARRAFLACDGGQLIVVDVDSGQELAAISISGPPDAIWLDRPRHLLYVCVPTPGVVDVIDTDRGQLIESITSEEGAKTSALDASSGRLYVFLPKSCAAGVFEDLSNE